ncbi:hypothetical protein GWK26_08705 [haloarchaeon 3A1-DGR]|nr:hypothetical protein GWK26_08705 [haloarchaeon 3A1-DGR]
MSEIPAEELSCGKCGDRFATERGLETHIGKMHDPLPEEKARLLYVEEGLTSKQIARKLGMSHHSVSDRLTEYSFWGMRPVNFTLEPASGYPTISRTGDGGSGRRIRLHRLVMIADGADPHKVFSGNWDVDHINGCSIDNRPENLRLMKKAEHGSKDGVKSECGYTHKDYLRALIQEPPEWADELSLDV